MAAPLGLLSFRDSNPCGLSPEGAASHEPRATPWAREQVRVHGQLVEGVPNPFFSGLLATGKLLRAFRTDANRAHRRPVSLVVARAARYKQDVTDAVNHKRTALFGPLPARGIWTALDLTRGQFLLILALSVVLFLFIGGPLWAHARDSHFWRIGLTYAIIPLAVGAALYRNGKARPMLILVATVVISLIKLVLTAALLVVIGVAQT